MQTVLLIALFGALGCVARHGLAYGVYGLCGRDFPYGTLAVNVIGAFLIGLLMEASLRSSLFSAELRSGLVVGFLGGLTTFSTFSYETYRLLEQGQFPSALLNVSLSVLACLACTWLGIVVARLV